MKILHSTFFLNNMGGRETLLIDIINEQCKEHTIYLLIIKDKVDINLINTIDKKVNVILFNKNTTGKFHFLESFIKLNKILKKIKPDIIHCHDHTLIQFFILWRNKTCLTVHLIEKSYFFFYFYKKIFAISNFVKKDLKRRAKLNSAVVWNGISVNQYQSRTQYEFNYREDEFKIIQISRISPLKGQETTVKAVSFLLGKYPDLNIKLYFVGDGNNLKNIKELVRSHNLSNNVVFCGAVERSWIKTELKNYMLLIQPSQMETFGLTAIEGFACGLPVILSNVGGLAEIKEILDKGIIFEVNNYQELGDKIYEIYKSYRTKEIYNSNFILKDKEQLMIFDIQSTASNYIKEYKKM